MPLEPTFAAADYPRLGGTSDMFRDKLGTPHESRVHGYLCHRFERDGYRLTSLYQGNIAIAVHCLYRDPPPWWAIEPHTRLFAPRRLRATLQPLSKWLQLERRRHWWTIAEPRVPAYVVRALVDGPT